MEKIHLSLSKSLIISAVLLVLSSWAVLAEGSQEQVNYLTFEGKHKDV